MLFSVREKLRDAKSASQKAMMYCEITEVFHLTEAYMFCWEYNLRKNFSFILALFFVLVQV